MPSYWLVLCVCMICSMMELDACKQLWGEIGDTQHGTEIVPAVTVKPASHVICHVPTLDVSFEENSTNE